MVSEEAKWEPELSLLLSGNEVTLHSVDYMRSSNEEHFPLDLNEDQAENLNIYQWHLPSLTQLLSEET